MDVQFIFVLLTVHLQGKLPSDYMPDTALRWTANMSVLEGLSLDRQVDLSECCVKCHRAMWPGRLGVGGVIEQQARGSWERGSPQKSAGMEALKGC